MIHKVAVERGMEFCGRPHTYMNDILKGKSLGMTTGNMWKQNRHFASKTLFKLGMKKKSYEKHILREVKAFTEVIEEQRNQPFKMKEHIHASLANVVFTSMIGEHEHIDTLMQSFRKLFGDMVKLLPKVSILLNCLPFLKYIHGDPLQLLTLQNEFQSFEKLTKERIIEPVLKNPPTEVTTFVDMYIEKLKEMENVTDATVFTFDQMAVVLNDLLAGGSETIPVTIRWAVLYLVNFPDIQERLQHHIDNMVPAAKVLCLDDKSKLPYVDAFIAEVLRCAIIDSSTRRTSGRNRW